MRLRKPCEHGNYDEHYYSLPQGDGLSVWYPFVCPGGEFLPEDALVIEKENGEWPEDAHLAARRWCAENGGDPFQVSPHYLFNALAADQVGEPG